MASSQREAAIAAEPATSTASQWLTALRSSIAEADAVSVGHMAAAAQGRIHGLLLIVLALPETVPMIGFSLVLATPIAAVALSLLIYGPMQPLPERIRARSVPVHAFDRALTAALPWIRRLERVTHPRWPAMGERSRPFGAIALMAAVIMAIPMPGANWLAGVCVVLTGLGLLQRDGLLLLVAFMILGLSLTLLLLLVTGVAGALAGLALGR